MTIRVDLNTRSIDKALRELKEYKRWIEAKAKELCQRLADIGVQVANAEYAPVAAKMIGADYNVTVESTKNGCRILADGDSILFLEFGAGITYGYGHPLNSEFGMGPGTFPPTNPAHPKWNSPNGWYTPGGYHTYGNPPAMGMYQASKDMRNQIEAIAREVFQH